MSIKPVAKEDIYICKTYLHIYVFVLCCLVDISFVNLCEVFCCLLV